MAINYWCALLWKLCWRALICTRRFAYNYNGAEYAAPIYTNPIQMKNLALVSGMSAVLGVGSSFGKFRQTNKKKSKMSWKKELN